MARPGDKAADIRSEWSAYKFLVLEHDQNAYRRIQSLIERGETSNNDLRAAFRSELDRALKTVPSRGNRVCASLHVWGRLKKKAKIDEKVRFFYFLDAYARGYIPYDPVRRNLRHIAMRHNVRDLLSSRFFSFG